MNRHEIKKTNRIAALAGLLHDIGKFAQRAGVSSDRHAAIGAQLLNPGRPLAHLIPENWRDDIGDAVAYHHGGDTHKPLVRAVRLADWLAASERYTGKQEQGRPEKTPLIPITARISLKGEPPSKTQWGYPLTVKGDTIFPSPSAQVSRRDYTALWEQRFLPRIENFPGPVDSFYRLAGLMDILADTTSYIPSATPWETEPEERTIPDVPLYNHLHLTAALAVCLLHLLPDELEQLHRSGGKGNSTVARLLKLDFSGIQTFIYRITEPADSRTYRHSAKRLRGRSLHLALLNREVGAWLARRMHLPPTNLLYAGGGIIEMLLPPDKTTAGWLRETLTALSKAFWTEFRGDLGVVWAVVDMRPTDFADVSTKREELEAALAQAKNRKWHERLNRKDFFAAQPVYHTCQVCGLTPTDKEDQTCRLCRLHEKIGKKLPYTAALLHSEAALKSAAVSIGLTDPMVGTVALTDEKEAAQALRQAQSHSQALFLEGVNTFPSAESWPAGSAPGQWTIANAAPVLKNEVLDFEDIANLSRGTPLLGILRADADRMGLVFSHGLHPPTFSRTVALSQTVARFFGPYLNRLAHTLTDEWRRSSDDKLHRTPAERGPEGKIDALSSIFYVLYAGGDDLFVIGPWDQTIAFALRLEHDFRAYTCGGQLTLSAGIVLVKPHFPIHQFARLAGEAEHKAKEAGRDRLHLFGRSLSWRKAHVLIEMAREWVRLIEAGEIPRGLIHDLGREARRGGRVFTPTLYYTLARRLSKWKTEERRAFAGNILRHWPDINVPVSYTSLITRKE